MNSVSSKTITICEKQTTPDLINNTSQCSCQQCDSYSCFTLRNMIPCSREKCPNYDRNHTTFIESKESSKSSKIGLQERIKKEITYENSKDHLDKSSNELSRGFEKSRKDFDSDTAKLSAQIMNVPYSDFKQSVSYNNGTDISRNTKLTKIDIFRRIKEAYKACSCKVCECIVGKSYPRNEFCKCKPCECKDCIAVMNNLNYISNFHRSSQGYGKGCKGLVKKSLSESQYCNCVPCDCIKCFDTYNEPCNCKPCECIECKAYSIPKLKPKAVIVGRVREDMPRAFCSCSPCECAECGQSFPLAESLRHEMSTGISRPANCHCETCFSPSCEENDNNRCSCDIQKQVMQKPNEKDTRDYDIHIAAINKPHLVAKPNSNPIAMFAAVKNTSPKFEVFSKECDCTECECLVCNGIDKMDKAQEKSCNCLPCECEVCKECNIQSTVHISKPCTCDICDCLKCDGYINMTHTRNRDNCTKVIKTFSNNQCKCKPCECDNCKLFMYKTGENNNCYQSYSGSTISCDQENLANRDETFIEPSFDKIKTFSKSHYDNDTEKPSASHYPLNKNIGQQDALRRVKYIKGSDNSLLKTVQELDKTSLMCDMYKQCTEKYVPQFDSNDLHKAGGAENSTSNTSKYCSDDFEVSFQSNLIQSQMQNNIISSDTSRRSLRGAVDKYISDKTKVNLGEDMNSRNNKVGDLWCRRDIINENRKQNDKEGNYFDSRIFDTKISKDMTKSQTNELEYKQKQILSVKKMSQDLAKSLSDANKKKSQLKYGNLHNTIMAESLQESVIKETVFFEKSCPDKIKDTTSNTKIDFEKVKHSLQQAKAFSMELVKILQQYQKLNHDYQKYSSLEFLRRSKYDFRFKTKQRSERCDNSLSIETHDNLKKNDKKNIETHMYFSSINDNTLATTSNKTDLIDYLLSDHETGDLKHSLNNSDATHQDDTKASYCYNDDTTIKEKHLNQRVDKKMDGIQKLHKFQPNQCSESMNKMNKHYNSDNELYDSKQILATSTSTFTLDETENNYKQLKMQAGRQHQKRHEEKKSYEEIEEVLPLKSKGDPSKKFTTNKCCYVAPIKRDKGQSTDASEVNEATDKYQNVLKEQFGFDPLMPETINQLKELREMLCNNTAKVDNSSQWVEDRSCDELANVDQTKWQTIDNVAEIDKYLAQEKERLSRVFLPENVRISETPRIKVIAKKFSKFKRNNLELRNLEEKVACVEYDVFIGNDVTTSVPREVLRAFFSIKPSYGKNANEKALIGQVPSIIKKKFNVQDEELKKFNKKEIEIIDGKMEENRSYLDDLKRVLKRKQAIWAKKNKESLDLMSLYEMAKRACPLDDGSDVNFLSKAELQEMKDLIISKCASSVYGINRRTLKKESGVKQGHIGVISQSIVAELWREGEKTLPK